VPFDAAMAPWVYIIEAMQHTLFSLWLALPPGLRRSMRVGLRKVKLPMTLLRAAGHPAVDGFTTETCDTPPAIEAALQYVRQHGLTGDYYEFGLYRGYTFWFAQQSARRFSLDSMNFWGFDSFCGLPPITGIDSQSPEFKSGDYSCDRVTVERNLDRYGVDWPRTHLIDGFFDKSLVPELKVQLGMKSCSVALIDCDLYSSTVPVLSFLADLLQPASIVLFDDYNCFGASEDMGERKAFREFLAHHPEWKAEPFIRFGWHGEGFILRSTT
jgi:hypothetical protein